MPSPQTQGGPLHPLLQRPGRGSRAEGEAVSHNRGRAPRPPRPAPAPSPPSPLTHGRADPRPPRQGHPKSLVQACAVQHRARSGGSAARGERRKTRTRLGAGAAAPGPCVGRRHAARGTGGDLRGGVRRARGCAVRAAAANAAAPADASAPGLAGRAAAWGAGAACDGRPAGGGAGRGGWGAAAAALRRWGNLQTTASEGCLLPGGPHPGDVHLHTRRCAGSWPPYLFAVTLLFVLAQPAEVCEEQIFFQNSRLVA